MEKEIMPFEHACFISYCHGQDIMKNFVEQLQRAIDDELSLHFGYESYMDTQRLLPGYNLGCLKAPSSEYFWCS